MYSFFQCSDALQSSPLTEAAELLDLLNHIEFEGLLFAHDKLAERQVSNEHNAFMHQLIFQKLFSSLRSVEMTLEFLTVFDGYEFKLLTFEKFDDFLFKVVSQAFKILNFNFYAAAFALFTFRDSQKPVQKMAPKFLTRGINKQKSFFFTKS